MARLLDTLYVAIKADAGGFEQGMSAVRAQLRNLGGDFKLPVAGAVGLASSLLAVGTAATAMAAEVDRGVRRATASMPSLGARTGELRSEIERLARETGISQRALADAFATAATTGVRSFTELTDVVRTAVRISEATGEDVVRVIADLDVALDAFNITASRTSDVGAKLYATSQGKFGFPDLSAAIQASVPTIREFNLDFDSTVALLARFLEEGRNPRQAAKELKEMAEGGGAAAVQLAATAEETITAAEAMERLRTAAQTNREDAANLAFILKEQLNAELIDLGNEILPTVNGGLRTMVDLIRQIRQARDKESLFAGTELTLPDTQGGLRTFIEQTERALTLLRQGQAEALKGSQDAEKGRLSDILYLPGFKQLNDALRAAPANLDLKSVTDEIEQLETALGTARTKLDELVESGRELPELVVTAPRGKGKSTPEKLSEDAKAAKRALDDLLALEQRLRSEFFNQFKTEVQIVRERAAALNVELAGGTPEQQEAGRRAAQLAEDWAAVGSVLDGFTPKVQVTTRAVAEVRDETDELNAGVVVLGNNLERLTDAQLLAIALRDLRDMADTNAGLFRVAEAVAAIAHSTGLLGDQALDAVFQFVQLGEVANDLGETIGRFNLGQASTGELLGASANFGLTIANTIAAAFTESPELKAAREALERNADELRRNTLGLQAFRQSGSELGRIEEAIASFAEQGLPGLLAGRSRISQNRITEELAKFGLSMDDLRQFAADAGIEFVELSRETLPQFLDFLEQLGIKIEQVQQAGFFGSGATGRLEGTRAGFRFSAADETGGQQFAGLVRAALLGDDPSRLLRDAFAGIDFTALDDPAVQAAAREAIRSLFTTVTAEGFDDFEGLGDFSGAEFIAFLEELLGLIPEIEAAPGPTAAEAVADALGALGRAIRVFDLSTVEQAEQFLGILTGFSPALAELLAGFDLSTVEGIDAVIAVLQDFYSKVEAGEISLEGTGLTIDILVDAIDRLQDVSAEAAAEIEQASAQALEESLLVRQLRARGLDEEADAEVRRQAKQREIDEAIAAGYTDAQLEAIRYTQALEDEAIAKEKATQAAEEARRAAERAEAERIATGEGALRRLREEFALFDIDDVVEQVQEFAGVLQAGGPIFQQLLAGLDLADPAARSEAIARLQQFAVQNPLGVDSGTFGASTVRQATLDLAELLKEANLVDVTSSGETGSFAINRQITEAGSERIAGQIGTTNIILGGIAADVAAIATVLGAQRLPPLLPPAIPSAGPAAGAAIGTSMTYITIHVGDQTIEGAPSPVVAGLIRQLSEALAHDLSIATMGG